MMSHPPTSTQVRPPRLSWVPLHRGISAREMRGSVTLTCLPSLSLNLCAAHTEKVCAVKRSSRGASAGLVLAASPSVKRSRRTRDSVSIPPTLTRH